MLLVGIVQGVRCFIGLVVSGPQTFPLAVAFHDPIRVVVAIGLRRTPALHQTAELATRTILQPPLRSSQSYFTYALCWLLLEYDNSYSSSYEAIYSISIIA
jgi:hypothetical protein